MAPFAQDLLTRVVNVHWGGVDFVGGSIFIGSFSPDAIISGSIATDTVSWTALGNFGIGEGGRIYGSSFGGIYVDGSGNVQGEATFVVVGRTVEGPHSGSIVLTSIGGKDWTVTYKKIDVSEPDNIQSEFATGVVWNDIEHNFYVACNAVKTQPGLILTGERLLRSADGVSWGLFKEDMQEDRSDWGPDSTSIISEYCTKPQNRGGIPDGLQAASGDIFMKPTDLLRFSPFGPIFPGYPSFPASIASTVTIESLAGPSATIDIGMSCYTVAVARSGVWVAGGGDLVASFDVGATWVPAPTPASASVGTVVGGK